MSKTNKKSSTIDDEFLLSEIRYLAETQMLRSEKVLASDERRNTIERLKSIDPEIAKLYNDVDFTMIASLQRLINRIDARRKN